MLNYENQLNLGNIYYDYLLILILNFSSELRQFCGIDKVPDASKWTRFKQDFCDYLKDMFIALVDATEPICQAINPTLANMISYDTSSVVAYVTENNAKYINSCIRRLKSYFKAMGIEKSDDDIYKLAYSSLPKVASSDSSIRKQRLCLNLNTLEVLKNLLANTWFSMF